MPRARMNQIKVDLFSDAKIDVFRRKFGAAEIFIRRHLLPMPRLDAVGSSPSPAVVGRDHDAAGSRQERVQVRKRSFPEYFWCHD